LKPRKAGDFNPVTQRGRIDKLTHQNGSLTRSDVSAQLRIQT
jgi:hypothetical protein